MVSRATWEDCSNEEICRDITAAIDGDDNPLDSLVERSRHNSGAVFEAATLAALADLKSVDRGAFEALRAKLKKAGVRMKALDDAMPEDSNDGRRTTQSDILIELAADADLFHASDDKSYADLDVNGKRATYAVRSTSFRRVLTRRYFENTGSAPNADALQTALALIEARAIHDGPLREVSVRVGAVGGKHYIDLGDDTWHAIEVDDRGWRIVDRPPVRFRRAAGALPLPEPKRGGTIERLRGLLNVDDEGFILAIAWLMAALLSTGPYPVLILAGEQGTAKSTFAGTLKSIVDPNVAPLRSMPREDRDLFIGATNAHLLSFDNVSFLPPWLSDSLARISTGGGFAVRAHYTDGDEALFTVCRPVILNGITDFVTRGDLADRAIFLTLEPIPEKDRKSAEALRADLDAARPGILGALLDVMVEGLRRLPSMTLPRLPRMADFALWAAACAPSYASVEAFWAAYNGNIEGASEGVLEADPVAVAVQRLAERARAAPALHAAFASSGLPPSEPPPPHWTGTRAELLAELTKATENVPRGRGWPLTPHHLSNALRRAAPALRRAGVVVTRTRDTTTRRIRVEMAP